MRRDEFLKQWKPGIPSYVTVIRFRLSTSDLTGLAIESSKPNPILIDVREEREGKLSRGLSLAPLTPATKDVR